MSIRQQKAEMYAINDSGITLMMQKHKITDEDLEDGIIEKQSDLYFEIWNFAHDAYSALCDSIGKTKLQRIAAKATKTKAADWSVFFCNQLFSKTEALMKLPSEKLVTFVQIAYMLLIKLKNDGFNVQLEYNGQLYRKVAV